MIETLFQLDAYSTDLEKENQILLETAIEQNRVNNSI